MSFALDLATPFNNMIMPFANRFYMLSQGETSFEILKTFGAFVDKMKINVYQRIA